MMDTRVTDTREKGTGAGSGRWPATAVFFLNGLTLSTAIARQPSLKSEHHLADGQVGALGLLFAVAAIVSMQFVGPLVARVGSLPVLRVSLVVMPLLLALVGLAAWFRRARRREHRARRRARDDGRRHERARRRRRAAREAADPQRLPCRVERQRRRGLPRHRRAVAGRCPAHRALRRSRGGAGRRRARPRSAPAARRGRPRERSGAGCGAERTRHARRGRWLEQGVRGARAGGYGPDGLRGRRARLGADLPARQPGRLAGPRRDRRHGVRRRADRRTRGR